MVFDGKAQVTLNNPKQKAGHATSNRARSCASDAAEWQCLAAYTHDKFATTDSL